MTVDPVSLMEGGVDTHVHSAPDLVERKLDDFEVARQAHARGMAAVVLKNHFLSTALRAKLVQTQVPGVSVVGSIVLNHPMGGMNPWAVEAAARAGAKVVWMPTFQAENQIAYQSRPGNPPHRADLQISGLQPGVKVFSSDGGLTPEAEAVLEIIRDRRMVLASGHLSPNEVERLTASAQEMGMRKIILTHPEMPVIALPVDLQRRLAERGVFFERTCNILNPPYTAMIMADLARRIREIGHQSTIMATDFGQTHNPTPADGLQGYIQGLLQHGFSPDEIRRMVSENARGLLEL